MDNCKWISVKDRLPEDGRPVLLYLCGKEVYTYTYQCAGFYVNRDNIADVYARKGWYELCYNGDYGDNFIADTVTHWMPLPKPPRHMGGK